MDASSISVNGNDFFVLSICDASMLEWAQKLHHIRVKTLRVETHIPVLQDSIFTPDVVMAAFFSADMFDPEDDIHAPVCLLEKKIGDSKVLEGYHYDGCTYSEVNKFTHTLNGFLGCTSFLNLGFYLLQALAGIETRSMCTIYFVDKHYLDNDKDDDEDCDTSLEKFLSSDGQE